MSDKNLRRGKTDTGEVFALAEPLENFVLNFANSLVKLEIIRFFTENPSVCDNMEGVACYIGRKPKDIEKELKSLVKSGLIDEIKRNGNSVFYCALDEELQKKVDLFLESLNDKITRLNIISRILQIEAKRRVLQ